MVDSEEIKIDYKKVLDFAANKRVINVFILIVFLILIIWTTSIRTQNLSLLIDTTSGEYIPLALDPFYFLRVAETMISPGGLPEYDAMRNPPLKVPFTQEILPEIVVGTYKIFKIFSPDITIREVHVLNPVVFFILGIIVFFFLVYFLTNSKLTALASSIFLGFIPPYLYRTMAGFADHESIGMFTFFLTLALLTISLKLLDKNKLKGKYALIAGAIFGIISSLTIRSWQGIGTFIFIIIPVSFLIYWLINTKELHEVGQKKARYIIYFYFAWLIFTVLFELFMGVSIATTTSRFLFSASGMIAPTLLLFMPIDYTLATKGHKITHKNIKKKRVLISIIITIILGLILYAIFVGNVGDIISKVTNRLINPFETGRVGITVAENKQPYLTDWFSQIGKSFFWLFFIGSVLAGINVARGIKHNKYKVYFSLAWIIFISSILFSRISANSAFNGENAISQWFYFIGAAIFLVCLILIYIRSSVKIKTELIILVAILIPMIMVTRGAIRLFFVIVPFVCIMVGYLLLYLFKFAKKYKDDVVRFLLIASAIACIILIIISMVSFVKGVTSQAKFTGPSANQQWQKAMSWVRNNTPEESIFVHWWDYGYWVQYLGKRATVTDGGHANNFWDHLVGRYVLTNPNPDSALSFMKAQDVSYLLIDPTDIGKYPAYSSIGSGEGETDKDRYSWIYVLSADQTQMQETRNGTLRVYVGNIPLDEDIIYEENGSQVFLPSGKAGLVAILFETIETDTQTQFKQPQGIFVYNGKQHRIPIRYIEYEEMFTDFKIGVEATAKIFPRVVNVGGGIQIDPIGTIMYLSPKVSESLFAQLYLMNDPQNLYPTLNLSHSEPDPIVENLLAQNAQVTEFIYYQGIRGPIKVWEVNYPEDIIGREEFLRKRGEYAEFDNLDFRK